VNITLIESTRGHVTLDLGQGGLVRFDGEWHLPGPGSLGFVLYSNHVQAVGGALLEGSELQAALEAFKSFAASKSWEYEIL
jgi:hypothetical protein